MTMKAEVATLLQAIEARSTELIARGAMIEAEGILPDDVLAWMIQNRLFKLCVPRSLGGAEFSLYEAVRVYEALAAIDGSLAWQAQIGSGGGFFVPSFRPEVARRLFEDSRAVIAGAGAPLGRARQVPGGYVVSGRWKYASGAQYATLFTANCVLEEGEGTTSEPRRIRAAAFLPHQVSLIRDWEALGMQATSGWSIAAAEVFIPEEHSFVVGEMLWDPQYSLYRVPFDLFAVASIGAICVGLARGFFAAAEGLRTAQEEAEHHRMLFFTAVEQLEAAQAAGLLDAARCDQIGWMIRRSADSSRELVLKALPFLGMRAIRPSERVNRILRDLLTAHQHVVLRSA